MMRFYALRTANEAGKFLKFAISDGVAYRPLSLTPFRIFRHPALWQFVKGFLSAFILVAQSVVGSTPLNTFRASTHVCSGGFGAAASAFLQCSRNLLCVLVGPLYQACSISGVGSLGTSTNRSRWARASSMVASNPLFTLSSARLP